MAVFFGLIAITRKHIRDSLRSGAKVLDMVHKSYNILIKNDHNFQSTNTKKLIYYHIIDKKVHDVRHEEIINHFKQNGFEFHRSCRGKSGACYLVFSTMFHRDYGNIICRRFIATRSDNTDIEDIQFLYSITRDIRISQQQLEFEEFLLKAGLLKFKSLLLEDDTPGKHETYILNSQSSDEEFCFDYDEQLRLEVSRVKREVLDLLWKNRYKGIKRTRKAVIEDFVCTDPSILNSVLNNFENSKLIVGSYGSSGMKITVAGEKVVDESRVKTEKNDNNEDKKYIVILEWNFTPPGYFEEFVRIDTSDYSMTFEKGKVEARIDSNTYEGNDKLHEELIEKLNSTFLGTQLVSHKKYQLTKGVITRLHPDGSKDITITPEPITLKTVAFSADYTVTDQEGDIISDTRRDRIEKKIRFATLAEKYRNNDIVASSILESFSSAVNDPNNELVHLYEIREALSSKFSGDNNARQVLGISNSKWSRLGKLANDEPLKQGRHRGKKSGVLRAATNAELQESRGIALDMIEAYLIHLEYENSP